MMLVAVDISGDVFSAIFRRPLIIRPQLLTEHTSLYVSVKIFIDCRTMLRTDQCPQRQSSIDVAIALQKVTLSVLTGI